MRTLEEQCKALDAAAKESGEKLRMQQRRRSDDERDSARTAAAAAAAVGATAEKGSSRVSAPARETSSVTKASGNRDPLRTPQQRPKPTSAVTARVVAAMGRITRSTRSAQKPTAVRLFIACSPHLFAVETGFLLYMGLIRLTCCR
jgi:hypothetical protein